MKEAIQLHRPPAHTITEFFGPMVRHLRRNAAVPAYAEIVELFQEIVECHVPVGAGDRFILPVHQRRLHSVQSAAIKYGMNQSRVRKLLEERDIIVHSPLSDRRVSFSIEDGEKILVGATENMTTIEVAAVLGTPDNRVRDIIGRGLLAVSERGVDANRPYYRVGRADLNDFRRRLFERASFAGQGHDLVPLSSVCRRKSLNLTDIVEMLLNGKLTRVARTDDTMTLRSLLVDLQEVPVSANGNHGQDNEGRDGIYLSMSEAKIALLTTHATVVALVKHAILPVEMRTNPRSRRKQQYVHRKAIEEFLESHSSLYVIARGWRRNFVQMKKELDQNGMKPIFETSGKIAKYYRKADLAEVGLLPPNA